MADTKISGLSAVTSLADADELVLNNSGTSKKVTSLNAKMFRGCRVSRSTNQTGIVTSTLTKVTFDAVRYGNTSWWAGGSPTKITVPYTGFYLVGGNLEFDGNATGERYADIFKNNTTILSELAGGVACTAAGTPELAGNSPVLLTANDFIEMRVYQNSGANRSVLTEPWGPDMWAIYLGV